MPQYQSHKKVWALKIATVTGCGTDTTTDENPIVEVTFEDKVFAPRKFNLRGKPTPESGWYFVQYADGYTSFSPAEAFETGHTPEQQPNALIENWFTYHAPNEDQQKRYVELRAAAKHMAYAILNNTKPSADQSAAFRMLRECVMTANASIALE